MTAEVAALRRTIDAAASARARLAHSVGDVAAALAEAATRWRRMPAVAHDLAVATGFAPAMLAEGLDDVVAPLEAAAMERAARRECAGTPAPPPVVAHVLASNVPALALPAMAHALLAGTAVVVKSGRSDRVSAPAFHAALAAVDPPLAATVVTAAWPRGDPRDAALLATVPLVALTGSDAALAALAPQARGRVLAFGARTSVAVLVEPEPAALDDLARDVACWEQQGCLSPHVAFVVGDAAATGTALAAALERLAARWPPRAADLAARAARRTALEEAAWSGARVHAGRWGAVVVDAPGPAAPGPGGRTIRVQPLGDLHELPGRLARGTIESVGTSGPVPAGLAALGVSRICHVGRMQRPSIAWPRGGRPPIRMLRDPDATATLEDAR